MRTWLMRSGEKRYEKVKPGPGFLAPVQGYCGVADAAGDCLREGGQSSLDGTEPSLSRTRWITCPPCLGFCGRHHCPAVPMVLRGRFHGRKRWLHGRIARFIGGWLADFFLFVLFCISFVFIETRDPEISEVSLNARLPGGKLASPLLGNGSGVRDGMEHWDRLATLRRFLGPGT